MALALRQLNSIHKKGPESFKVFYCPVSLLFVVSKVFEKLVNNRIVDHLENCGPFTGFQYGFRPSQSTGDLLAVASDRIARDFNKFGATQAVALDIPKAFDRVWPESFKVFYCPVSLLFVVSKVFEKLVNNRIVDHLENCGPFTGFQYGFRPSQSTGDLLTIASDRITRILTSLGLLELWHLIYLRLLTGFGLLVFFTNLKLVSAIFYQIFISSSNDRPSKL